MATSHSSPSSPLLTPHSSPILRAPFDLAAGGKPISPRKRRLTAPPDFQLGENARKLSKRARLIQGNGREDIHIVDDVDELIPQFRTMGKDTSLYTPQSSGFDASSVPFVFDDGVLSFYTPSPDSNDTDYNASPPASSASSTSFLGVLPDQPRRAGQPASPIFHGLSIWRGGEDRPAHVYAQSINRYSTKSTLSLHKLDPFLSRYGPVHTARAQLRCPFTHVDVPLTPVNVDIPFPVDSVVTISAPRGRPVRAVTALYRQGYLVSSDEAQTEEEPLPHSEDAFYSTSLPKNIVDEFCRDVDRRTNALDSIVVMQFIQQDEVAFVVVFDFHTGPGEVKVAHILPEKMPSQEILPTPPSSSEPIALDAVSSSHRVRPPTRPIPKLSVAIPPSVSIHSRKGRIQLCSDSPGLTPDSAMRPTPMTGIPHNVLPVTPFEQLIRTPSHPPDIPRNTIRSSRGYTPTPTESTYPFTLSSTSPGGAQSPAFGVLDSAAVTNSAPAWPMLSRNITPLSPSFFLHHPHTAAASNVMSSMTQRAIDAGTPMLRRADYFDPPLASPHRIAGEPLLPEPGRPSSSSVP